jgi:hypothetical protein
VAHLVTIRPCKQERHVGQQPTLSEGAGGYCNGTLTRGCPSGLARLTRSEALVSYCTNTQACASTFLASHPCPGHILQHMTCARTHARTHQGRRSEASKQVRWPGCSTGFEGVAPKQRACKTPQQHGKERSLE